MGVNTTEMNSNMWSEPQYWKSDHIIEEIPKIIINLDSDSDTDSDGDHDSEGETTDMYWSE
jgi:hypothetical protein